MTGGAVINVELFAGLHVPAALGQTEAVGADVDVPGRDFFGQGDAPQSVPFGL